MRIISSIIVQKTPSNKFIHKFRRQNSVLVILSLFLGLSLFTNSLVFADGHSVVITEIMYHPKHESVEAENSKQEFIEILNSGNTDIDLSGWQFTNGIRFNFPDMVLKSGEYLVIAADLAEFKFLYYEVENVIGGWNGKLSNSGERIELEDDSGETVDEFRYADEGVWAVRELDEIDNNHRGWTWSDAHDGNGKSLELINPSITNECGQNWSASEQPGGTPGAENSVHDPSASILFLDVDHYPIVPKSGERVAIVVETLDDMNVIEEMQLYYRPDGQNDFYSLPMNNEGKDGDVVADDQFYTAEIEAMPHGTIVEFYIQVSYGNHSVTYPAPCLVDGISIQSTNLLYEVDDTFPRSGFADDPVYLIIMKEEERAELIDVIGSGIEPDRDSNAQMNATFISADDEGIKNRYQVGVRVRGKGTRKRPPVSLRINFRSDRTWNDVTAINLNTKFTHLQLLGSAVFKEAGLPAANVKPVSVLINGQNLALSETIPERMYGKYAYVEVIDGDFTGAHFPNDDGGNVYRCMRLTHDEYADWRYEGDDPLEYSDTYFKETNTSEFDWSDLIQLTNIMNNASDENYVNSIHNVLNVEQWLHWFAIEVLLSNNETNPSSGQGDDYYMYRGENDTRFYLLPHDLDTIFGQGREKVSAATLSMWAMNQMPAIERFMTHPAFATDYYLQLKELGETIFEKENFRNLVDDVLGDWAAQEPVLAHEIELIKTFVENRKKFILTGGYPHENRLPEIPQYDFTVECHLEEKNGQYYSMGSDFDGTMLSGTADVFTTRSITANDVPVSWFPVTGTWQIDNTHPLQLIPGENQITISACSGIDGTGDKLDSQVIQVYYEENTFKGILESDTTLLAALGRWRITGDIVIPKDRTLTIEQGTELIFEEGTGILVEEGGCLIAEGDESQRIVLSSASGDSIRWNGVQFVKSMSNNRLCYMDMEYADNLSQAILVDSARVLIDHMTWTTSNKKIIKVENPSLVIQHSTFPEVSENEPIQGNSLAGNQYLIIKKCTFHSPSGYNDVIDFSDCKRPGPILQLYDNTFLGGTDDALDLDGCDAHIEGNVFMNFHKSHGRESTSNGIATGIYNNKSSDITVVRNLFYNNDHAILLKQGCFLHAENNVFVNHTFAAINFSEIPFRDLDPGKGAVLDGNIFYGNTAEFENQFSQPGKEDPSIVVNRNIIDTTFHTLGFGNLFANPQFVDSTGDFHLLPTSPAIGMAANGIDMGCYVPAGVSISGEPDSLTKQTDVVLTIDGPGITHYQYVVNDSNEVWSETFDVDSSSQIILSDLVDGQSYTVYARGLNTANAWQANPAFTSSKTWKIQLSDTGVETMNSDKRFQLFQNVPNPFNATTIISFELPKASSIQVQILDLMGRRIRNYKKIYYHAGRHQIVWNGKDASGIQMPTGIYFVEMHAEGSRFTKKMLMLK